MTLLQGAELVQNLVKNGLVRGDDTLKKEHYVYLIAIARDYILFQKKGTTFQYSTNSSVVNKPKEYEIKNGVATLPPTLNMQGIVSIALLNTHKQPIDNDIFPLYAGAKSIVSNMFSYYIPLASAIEFLNIPTQAKYVQIYSISGADLNDNVSNDIMFLIIKEVINIGFNSEKQINKDTTADGVGLADIIQTQIREANNTPNKII